MADRRVIRLTPAQELIHAGQVLAGEAPLYNMGWRFAIRGALDPARFDAAFEQVVAQHDGLRLRLETSGQSTTQCAARDAVARKEAVLDLRASADPVAEADRWIAAETARPLDLSQTTWRSRLLRLADAQWIWFFVQHHVAADATSGRALFHAVADAYAGAKPRDAVQFLDHVATSTPNEEKKAYWAEIASQPWDREVPYGAAHAAVAPWSDAIEVDFGVDRSAALDALAAAPGFQSISAELSRFALLMTAHVAWLHRVARKTEVSVGAPAHLRFDARQRAALGLFVETFPFHVHVAPRDTFRELFAKVMRAALLWLRHAQPGASSPASAAAFDTVLNYLPLEFGDFAGLDSDVRFAHAGAHDPHHHVQLSVTRFGGTAMPYRLHFRLNREVFGGAAGPRATKHWLAMAGAMLADPDRRIGTVALGGETLKGPPAVRRPTVLEAFDRCLRQTPDAIAVEEGARTVTYRAFDALVSRYAEGCRDANLGAGDLVLVCARRSIDTLAAIWGVLRAGAAFAPFAADTPVARLRAVITQNGIRAAIRSSETDALGLPLHVLPKPPSKPFPSPPRDACAYAIFTSGSTGTPKGVRVDHDGLARYAGWASDTYPGDHALHSTLGFDLTITALFAPLLSGHRVVIYPETGTPDLAVLDVFEDDRVDVVKLTPSHLALALERTEAVERIGTLILGGEALPTELARRAVALSRRGLVIANEYGPTEAVVGAMLHHYDPAEDCAPTVSIGRPVEGVSISVRDENAEHAPVGVPGELYISGRLAVDYLGRPDLTAEKFPVIDGERLYRSGDLGRVEADGRVSYLGRIDAQIKASGMRIEPAEIVLALEAIPGIRQAHTGLWQPAIYSPDAPSCVRCGLSAQAPGGTLDGEGVCVTCRDFEAYRDRADVYFEPPDALSAIIRGLRAKRRGRFDIAMLLSGGKDSTYALYRLAELTSDILCLTLDNGYLSEEAKANISAVADDLGLEHRFLSTPAMNAIFRDSLLRHSNVCQGCFKTIYTLALRTAREEGIPAIATGLSRGQFFETRLTPELFGAGAPRREEIEATVIEARKSYHRVDDAVFRNLDTGDLADPTIFDEIAFIDLYRYIDVPVDEIYRFLDARAWQRPSDTGRSTNCRINDLGIFVHTRREGYHNYAQPYAWDVRMGHKTRDGAMEELRDAIDPARMKAILGEIGLPASEALAEKAPELVAWVVGEGDPETLRSALRATLPPGFVPARIVKVDTIPLSAHGKVDTKRLPAPPMRRAEAITAYAAPEPGLETDLATVFAAELGIDRVGACDNFYDLGGDSLAAVRIALRAVERGLTLEAADIFRFQTVRALAHDLATRAASRTATRQPSASQPLVTLDADALAAIGRALTER